MKKSKTLGILEITRSIVIQYGSVKSILLRILVRVGGLCITSGDFSRWLTEPYWIVISGSISLSFISIATKPTVALFQPDSAEIYLQRGINEFKNQHNPAAIDNFRQALKINPKYAPAYYHLGLVYTDRYNKAAEIDDTSSLMECSVKREQSLQVSCRHLTLYEWQQQQQQRAISSFNKAIKLQPQYPEAYHARGSVYLPNASKAKKDWQQAKQIWKQALDLEQTAAEISCKTHDFTKLSSQLAKILTIAHQIDIVETAIYRLNHPGSPSGYSAIDKSLRDKLENLYAEANRLLKQGNIQAARAKYQEIKLVLLDRKQLQEYQEVERMIGRLDRLQSL